MAGTIPTLVAPSSRTWLGIAREIGGAGNSGAGTPVSPTNTIPLDKSSYEPEDTPKFLEDLAIRGSMSHRFADVLGVEDASFSFGGPVYGDVWGYFIDNVFGDLSTTGSTPANGTTLINSGGVVAGGTTITVSAPGGYANGATVQIDAGSVAEVVILNAAGGVTGSVLTFSSYPLRFAHASAATVTTVTGPYTHKWAVLNQLAGYGGMSGAQPPTHTITDYTSLTTAVGARAYPSLCIGQLDFTGNSEQLFMGKVSGNSWLSAAASTTPTNTTTFTTPLPAWNSTITIGGTAITSVNEWAFAFKRELGVYWTEEGATQNPYVIARGDLDVTGSLKFAVPSTEDPLLYMLNHTQPTLQVVVTNGLAGVNQIQFTIAAQVVNFAKAKPNRSGVLVGYDDDWRAVANTTNVGGSAGLGEATITLINNTATY